MELEEVLSEGHSEDEVDDEVADFEELRRLGNFDNVTNAEKKFMHMWNSFIRKQRAVLAWLSIIAHRNKDMKAGEKLISVADVECESEGANKMVAYLRETASKSKTGDKF
ncbi:hypothetical protein Ahy_B06g082755 [Arachis hypogaea]|uniref:Polycomb protein VEFS-Box domain-containing protein n=1 Tax=Arachis hypogaea TaxID=3818 RepID=A0A444YNW1_ARAHY|nr:hypothetical protein Ahy_B06g082755 [Arachis hypogaea]